MHMLDGGSGDAVVSRLNEGFRSLTTEEQMWAILSAKRKPATSANVEAQASEQPEDKDSVAASVETPLS